MALPNISNFILGTRQPLDFVGPAIDAWRTVSAEARATRAQNLAEVEAGRDAGQQAYDNQVDAVKLQDSLLNSATNREATMGHLEVRQLEHAAKMEQMKWERQNLLPLKMQSYQQDIMLKGLDIEATRMAMGADRAMLGQFQSEMQDAQSAIQGIAQGPQEGQEAEGYYDNIRQTHALLENMEQTWGKSGNPAIQQQIGAMRSVMEKVPGYRYLQAQPDGLLTPEKRDQISREKDDTVSAYMPFSSDAEAAAYMQSNSSRLAAMKKLPMDQFREAVQKEATRYQKEKDSLGGPAIKPPTITGQEAEALVRYRTAINSNAGTVDLFGDGGLMGEGGLPLDQARDVLRSMGVPDESIPAYPTPAGQTPSYFPRAAGGTRRDVPGMGGGSTTFDPFAN